MSCALAEQLSSNDKVMSEQYIYVIISIIFDLNFNNLLLLAKYFIHCTK